MPGITDAADFVPDDAPAVSSTPTTAGGLAAVQSAAARISPTGGLAAGLSPGDLYAASKPLVDETTLQEIQDTVMSRIRTPESVERGAQARRGALESLQAANRLPDNDWSPQRMVALGMASNDRPWDVTHGWRQGIAAAMKQDLQRQGTAKKAEIDNAALGLKFEQNEEGYADKLEGNAVGQAVSLATASQRIAAFQAKQAAMAKNGGGRRFIPVAGVGVVDTYDLDENGAPRVKVAGPELARMMQANIKVAAKQAEGMDFTPEGELTADQVRQRWIQSTAKNLLQGAVVSMLDPQLQNSGAVKTGSVNPGTAPAGAPAAGGLPPVGSTVMRPTGPTNAGERGMAAGIGALPNGGATDGHRDPAIPKVSDVVAQNAKDITRLEEVIKDPKSDPDMIKTATQQRDALLAANLKAMKADISNIGNSPTANVPAPGVVAKPVQPVVPSQVNTATPGVELQTRSESGREQKHAETMGAEAAKLENEMYHKPVMVAQSTLSSVAQTRPLIKDFKPGKLAPVKQFLGNWMEAAGLDNSLVREAKSINDVAKLFQKDVNAKVKGEVGVQTDSDVQRMASESASITDPIKSLEFSLNQSEEHANRVIARSAFVKQMQNSKNIAKQDIATAWQDHAKKTLGPPMTKIGSKPVFRSEFIQAAIAANPDMSEDEVRAAASADWLEINKPKGKK